MLHRTWRPRALPGALACALIAAVLAAPPLRAGPISGYPAATTPLSGSETAIGTQSGSTVQITTQSIANILLPAPNTWTAVQTFPAPGASAGSIVLTPGTASGTPPNGSLWTTSAGLFVETTGSAHQLADLDSNTFTGEQSFAASTTANAGVNLGQGSAPTSPANGDLWITSAGLFARAGGVTTGPFTANTSFATLGANTFTGEQNFAASTLANAGVNLGQGQGPTSPVNGDLWVTASGVFAEVNGAIASLGVTVPTAAAGGSNTQVQYNCSSVLCGATGFGYSTTNHTLTGPDSSTWANSGITIGPSSKLNTDNTWVFSASTPLIAAPSCGGGVGGATWMVGGDAGLCSHATTGATDNLAFGTIIFQSLTSGCCNTAMGSENMKNVTTGSYNTGIGFEADHIVTTGNQNTGIGGSALDFVTSGSGNIGVGNSAGSGITTGSFNVCIYSSCGANSTMSGSNNVVVGGGGATLTTGSRNIFVGPTNNSAGYGIATGNGNIAIGGQFATLTDQSDSITIADGDGNVLEQYLSGNGFDQFRKPIRSTGSYIGSAATTVSGLTTADPSPSAGDRGFVTDATSCTFNSSVTGGGSTKCPVVYSGSSWVAG